MAADEENAALANESTPDDLSTQEEIVETATETVDEQRGRIADLTKRLEREGRSKAQIKAQTDAMKADLDEMRAELAEAKADRDRMFENYATPEEREARQRQAQSRERGEIERLRRQNQFLLSIETEENPKVKAALGKIARTGEAPTARQLEAIRSMFEDDDESAEDKAKAGAKPKPVAVGNVRSTGQATKTVDDEINALKKAGKGEDALALMLKKQMGLA